MVEGTPPNLSWFPRLQAMSLDSHSSGENEQNLMRNLSERLQRNNDLMERLQGQLSNMERTVAYKRHKQHRSLFRNDPYHQDTQVE